MVVDINLLQTYKSLLESRLVIENKLYLEKYLEYIANIGADNYNFKEAHHILPRCLFPEYAKCEENVVFLTPSEHYTAHKYLALIGKNNQLWYSFNMMKNTREHNRLIEDEDYNIFKERFYKLIADMAKQNCNFTRETNIKYSHIRWSDEEQRNKQKVFMLENNPMNSLENREKVSASKKGKQRLDMRGIKNPMRNKQVAELFCGKNNPNYIGSFLHSSGRMFDSKSDLIKFLSGKIPNKTFYFYNKICNYLIGNPIVIKKKEVYLFKEIEEEFKFIKK